MADKEPSYGGGERQRQRGGGSVCIFSRMAVRWPLRKMVVDLYILDTRSKLRGE